VTIATTLLTELVTSIAAAVPLFPVAMAIAAQLELNPRAFAGAVTIAASTSFVTPIGYQTNTLVYGMGGYRSGDFVRLGLPVTLVSLAVIVIFVPLFRPL
jgi:di/tricarboxylate transporter